MSRLPQSHDPRPPRGGGLGWWLALVLGAVALVAFLAARFPDTLSTQGDWAHVFYLVALLALVSSGILAGRRLGLRQTVKQAAAWAGIALVIVVGYSFRSELRAVGERVLGDLLPHRGTPLDGRSVVFRAGADGHFRSEALVDGTPVRFLLDTGASDVVLSPADAARLGFDPATLSFTRRYETANGVVRGAPVRLGEVAIGPIRVGGVPASVNEAPMGSSLLGMSFLSRLRSYEVEGDSLTLRR